ncbi:hypothetical protein E2C01_005222 [Portunus trituberculatus]|uniref:Uncharacterized protein n=1 Tax=Portunus trituberculatus TaxID=210409 RepID=A0A5B7CYJ8_PORTR|nr:hypothetical protein [Portunus trituberculatus]
MVVVTGLGGGGDEGRVTDNYDVQARGPHAAQLTSALKLLLLLLPRPDPAAPFHSSPFARRCGARDYAPLLTRAAAVARRPSFSGGGCWSAVSSANQYSGEGREVPHYPPTHRHRFYQTINN